MSSKHHHANPYVSAIPSRAVRRTAIIIAQLLAQGRCISRAEFELETGASRRRVALALQYLFERGIAARFDARRQCWYVELEDVDWRALRAGELVDMGFVPDDEQVLLDLAVRSLREKNRRRRNALRASLLAFPRL